MALDKATLKQSILNILNDLSTRTDNPETAREDFATAMSDAMDAFVRSGSGIYQAGTMTAGQTPVTAVGVPIKIE